jgi:hypothetical protein
MCLTLPVYVCEWKGEKKDKGAFQCCSQLLPDFSIMANGACTIASILWDFDMSVKFSLGHLSCI